MVVPFAALATLANGIMGLGQTGAQNQLLGMQITEAKDARRKGERLARSSRTDAMGNKTYYDEASNSWMTEAAPLVKAILEAQSREQLKNVTEDATRNREASIRKDQRSRSAGAEYDKRFAERVNRPRRSEEDYQADAVLSATRKRNSIPPSLFMAAQRSGDPKALQQLVAAAQQQEGSLTDIINSAKSAGTEQYLRDRSMRDQVDFSELDQLKGTADGVDGYNPMFSNANSELAGRQEGALQQLIAAIAGGSAGVSSALGNAAANVKAPNIGALIEGIGGLFPEKEDPNAAALAAAIQDAQLAEAQYKAKDYRAKMNAF